MERMLVLYLHGNTYPIKEELKSCGFRWDSDDKVWYKNFDLDEEGIGEEYVRNLGEAYCADGQMWYELTGDLEGTGDES